MKWAIQPCIGTKVSDYVWREFAGVVHNIYINTYIKYTHTHTYYKSMNKNLQIIDFRAYFKTYYRS